MTRNITIGDKNRKKFTITQKETNTGGQIMASWLEQRKGKNRSLGKRDRTNRSWFLYRLKVFASAFLNNKMTQLIQLLLP